MKTTSSGGRLFVRAVQGDDDALDALTGLAIAGDWLAGWALQTAIELRAGGSESVTELPSLSPDIVRRLEQIVRDVVDGDG